MTPVKKKLKEYPELERQLWRAFDQTPFEDLAAMDNLSLDQVLKLLDYPAYFDLMGLPLPENRDQNGSGLDSKRRITPARPGSSRRRWRQALSNPMMKRSPAS